VGTGPRRENRDELLGGVEPGLSELAPNGTYTLNRSNAHFGDEPGPYVIGVSCLSQQDHWHNITAGAPGTTGQQQVTLRRLTNQVVDKWVDVPESAFDVDTGVDMQPADEFSLTGSGAIWAGVWLTGENGPEGWTDRRETNPRSPMHEGPDAHPFSLVGRFDGLPFFYIGAGLSRRPYPSDRPRRLNLRMNDDTVDDA
jgi:hypothetical protein